MSGLHGEAVESRRATAFVCASWMPVLKSISRCQGSLGVVASCEQFQGAAQPGAEGDGQCCVMTVHDVIYVGNRNICRLRMGQQGEEIISKRLNVGSRAYCRKELSESSSRRKMASR